MALSDILAHGTRQPILGNSLRIALLVGTVLNVINQWQGISHGSGINVWTLCLNYLVPFLVSNFSASLHAAQSARENQD